MLSKKKIAVSFLSPTKQLSDEIHAEELGDQIREDKVFLPCPLLFCIRARRRVLSMYSIYPGRLPACCGLPVRVPTLSYKRKTWPMSRRLPNIVHLIFVVIEQESSESFRALGR